MDPSSKCTPRARCASRMRPISSLTKGTNLSASDRTVPRAATGNPRRAAGLRRRTQASLICVPVVDDATASEKPTRRRMRQTASRPRMPPAGSIPTVPAKGTAPPPSHETKLATNVNARTSATGRKPLSTLPKLIREALRQTRSMPPHANEPNNDRAENTPAVAINSKTIFTRASTRAAGVSGTYSPKAADCPPRARRDDPGD